MKLSLNWLKDYVKIPDDMDLSRLAYDLTMSTVEIERIIDLGKNFDNMVLGEIKEIFSHPDADKLKVCKVDAGNDSIRDIVCGGINVKEGIKVAVALPGAKVRWHGEGDLIEIKKSKVRGIESSGMICASSEIGLADLFPSAEEAAIMDLSDFDFPAGTPLAAALGFNDMILEIDNKSLTNRPDLWGHYGIAREIAALYDLPLKGFAPFFPPSTSNFTVAIDDPVRCPRYIGVKLGGLFIKPSPFEIQSRIWRVGIRPANAIVDITNYVLLAIGQPTHAFDADCIKGRITVRRAYEAEKIVLLNGRELSLSAEDLVIADNTEDTGIGGESHAVALAGVMGGEKDSILPATKNVILEIANFEAINIRRTAARYETRTEAAARYEKAIDTERCDQALSLAMQMFEKIYPQMSVTGFCDNYPDKPERSKIDVPLDWLEKRLGKHIPDNEIEKKLTALGFDVIFDNKNMCVTAPSWRSTGDISIPDDIMEEVARMYGFENFEAAPITTTFTGAVNQLDIDRKIREYFAFRRGLREIFSYPWMSDDYAEAILHNTKDLLSLSTPPSPNEHYIRSSHLPNLCKAVTGNLRYFSEFAIFESAQIFFNRDFKSVYDERESLPFQKKNTAGAFVGNAENTDILFRKAKGVLEALPRYVHTEPVVFEKQEKPGWADDVLWLNICHDNKIIGNLGLLSKKAALACGIKNSAVILFELDIDSLKPYSSRTNKFSHLAEYPVVDYDISMLFDLSVKWKEIFKTITDKRDSNKFLQSISFVDEYRGGQVPDGKKSLTFRLMIGSPEKTLTSTEIENCANTAVQRLIKTFNAELRGKL